MVDLIKQHPGDDGVDNYAECFRCRREVRVWIGVPGTLGGVVDVKDGRSTCPHTTLHHVPTAVPPWQRRNGVAVRTRKKARRRWWDECDPLSGCSWPGGGGGGKSEGCDGIDGCDIGGGCLLLALLVLVQVLDGAVAPRRALARYGERAEGGWLTRRVLATIRLYQLRVSPRYPARCRLTPTCSAYGAAAVRRLGPRRGLRLTAARVRRCGRRGDRQRPPLPAHP